jgi:hypothetical protein
MPHERVAARELGLLADDGRTPWAAWQLARAGRTAEASGAAWAWLTPCHWHVATDHITMAYPPHLQLSGDDSRQLLDAMRPYFEQDGIHLEYDTPVRWLARGEIFRDLATASLDRVSGRTIDEFMPRAAQAKTLRRLQQEMQMLLYTHEINDKRIAAGLPAVNSFWASGAGELPAGDLPSPPLRLEVIHSLRDAALVQDWPGWTSAWQQLDAAECAALAQKLSDGQPISITLCGERNAQTWTSEGTSWFRRARAAFSGKRVPALLATL